MVACKSTVRERWAQILPEADRISTKFLLTVDTRLTAATIGDMAARSLLPFLPKVVIETHYADHPAAHRLGTVEGLLNALRPQDARMTRA
jgi:hypothetical protein